MSEKKFYCYCESNCKYETMTREQILSAITQAVSEGTVGDVDTGFVTTLKTITGTPLRFFVGTQAEYEALSEEDRENLFALISNDTTKEAIFAALKEFRSDLDSANAKIEELREDVGTAEKLVDGAVTTEKIAEGAVTANKLAMHSVTSVKINSKAVTESKIDDYAVTTEKIAVRAVTSQRLGNGAVTTEKIAEGAVTEEKIAHNAVTEDKIDDGAVTSDKLADDAVTSARIADKAVTRAKIANYAISTNQLETNSVFGFNIAEKQIEEKHINSNFRKEIGIRKKLDIESYNDVQGDEILESVFEFITSIGVFYARFTDENVYVLNTCFMDGNNIGAFKVKFDFNYDYSGYKFLFSTHSDHDVSEVEVYEAYEIRHA